MKLPFFSFRVEMEATAWMRNKKVSGLGAAKSLFFIFCLLTLISQTSCNLDKQELVNKKSATAFYIQKIENTILQKKKHMLLLTDDLQAKLKQGNQFLKEQLEALKVCILFFDKFSLFKCALQC